MVISDIQKTNVLWRWCIILNAEKFSFPPKLSDKVKQYTKNRFLWGVAIKCAKPHLHNQIRKYSVVTANLPFNSRQSNLKSGCSLLPTKVRIGYHPCEEWQSSEERNFQLCIGFHLCCRYFRTRLAFQSKCANLYLAAFKWEVGWVETTVYRHKKTGIVALNYSTRESIF